MPRHGPKGIPFSCSVVAFGALEAVAAECGASQCELRWEPVSQKNRTDSQNQAVHPEAQHRFWLRCQPWSGMSSPQQPAAMSRMFFGFRVRSGCILGWLLLKVTLLISVDDLGDVILILTDLDLSYL